MGIRQCEAWCSHGARAAPPALRRFASRVTPADAMQSTRGNEMLIDETTWWKSHEETGMVKSCQLDLPSTLLPCLNIIENTHTQMNSKRLICHDRVRPGQSPWHQAVLDNMTAAAAPLMSVMPHAYAIHSKYATPHACAMSSTAHNS
jgi:hypothetical protein